MADEKQTSAIFKRHEQLKRWEESDTNKCPTQLNADSRKVKFQDGCIFLAACSSSDRDEVKRLLERGADINTANIDGLTALHQACIDDNLDMVEFLVENGADVDVCDNEGWTPLHATASCGFTEIARYLLRSNCNVAAVNNDGDLSYDICEDDEMEKLLQMAMDEQGVDAEAARRAEEDAMLADANQWLSTADREDIMHPKTGATPLHVASAKGYITVMNVLLQGGTDSNAKDLDGWTPLHAAAHWGQEESCKVLAGHMCDMEAKNTAGQTAFDVADSELIKLLEELKLKQASLKDQQKDTDKDIIPTKLPSSRRSRNDPARSSVTRMSVEQKHNVMKTVEGDRIITPTKEEEPEPEKVKGSSSSCSDEETSESETEQKKNEINKQTSGQNQPRDRDKPPIMTTVEIKEKEQSDMPKIEESLETSEKENLKKLVDGEKDLKNENQVIGDGLKKDKILNKDKTEIKKEEEERDVDFIDTDDIKEEKDKLKDKQNEDNEEKKEKEIGDEKKTESNKDVLKEKNEKDKDVSQDKDEKKPALIEDNVPLSSDKEKELLKRTVSAPTGPSVSLTEVPKISINAKSFKDGENKDVGTPSSRQLGLRKTGSTSLVPGDIVSRLKEDEKNLPRSASSPRLAEDIENKKNERNDKPGGRRALLSSSSFSTADHNNSSNLPDSYLRWKRLHSGTSTSQASTNPYRFSGSALNSTSGYQTAYVPFYRRQQAEAERRERERTEKQSNRISAPASLPITTGTVTTGTVSSPSSTSSSPSITTPTSSIANLRKSYEPPKRDEETEMLRKVRAKRARETRRSTQGVTLEDVQQANEALKRPDDPLNPTATTTTATTTTPGLDRSSRASDDKKSQGVSSDLTSSSSSVGNMFDRDNRLSGEVNLRRTQSSNESDISIPSWRRSREVKDESNKKEDDSLRGSSYSRRSRAEKDLSSSTPSGSLYSHDSTYVPRSQRADRSERNALSVADIGNSSLGGTNLTRSTSLRTDRVRATDSDPSSRIELRKEREREREKEKEKEKEQKENEKLEEKRPESAAIRSRRMRRERRSTGIANYTAENDDEDKDKENDESRTSVDRTDGDEKGTRVSRYGSASDVPSHLSSRPSSYSEYSRSATSLEKDYKKLYEDERHQKEQLRRDLEQCKKELREAKAELDRQVRRHEANRLSDTNDKREKRALERKLSELEEEIKKMDQLKEDNRRLREENGALIRVISKLSK